MGSFIWRRSEFYGYVGGFSDKSSWERVILITKFEVGEMSVVCPTARESAAIGIERKYSHLPVIYEQYTQQSPQATGSKLVPYTP